MVLVLEHLGIRNDDNRRAWAAADREEGPPEFIELPDDIGGTMTGFLPQEN
jgi:hypothetical protein